MKLKLVLFILPLMMSIGLTSCGKKAKDKNANEPQDKSTNAESAIIEETHKELFEAILINDIVKVQSLLEKKSQVNLDKILENGETLMTLAVKKDLYQIVELLIANKASLFRTNIKSETPLIIAAGLGHENVVRLLISLGSKTDAKDVNGNTALHIAIINSHDTIALFLINSRANIDITNNDNQTALKLAEIINLKKVVDLLRSLTQSSVGLPNKIDVRNLISLGDVESLNQLFIKYPVVVYEYRDLDFYVLIISSHEHDKALSMTHLMMGYGANLDGHAGSDTTALIEVVKRDFEDFVNLLLNENVNPNIIDDKGNSALIWAIKRNNQNIVKMLIEKNATQKYNYYEAGRKRVMRACDVAREMTALSTTSETKKSNSDIKAILGCSLWPF